jgi:protein SCO1/2
MKDEAETMNDRRTRVILWGIAGTVGLILGAAAMIYQAQRRPAELPVIGQVTPFEFTERDGRPFGEHEMKGKISVVNFFFTTCSGPCPRMNAQVADLYKFYAGSDRIQFISISVDPDKDSLAALQGYARALGVTDQRWVFLRGKREDVQQLSEKVFLLAGDMPTMHSTKLVLVDERAQIRAYYSSEEPENMNILKTHIRELAKELK